MDDGKMRSIVGSVAAVVIGAAVAAAGSEGSAVWNSFPVFAICAIVAFGINWLVFIPSSASQTEKYYDITGSFTYVTMTIVAVLATDSLDLRAAIAAAMVVVWTVRLGSFLFKRIQQEGKDGRFDRIKTDPLRFLMAWTIQGLWVLLTAAAALAIITTATPRDLGWIGYSGIAIWLAGFAIEVAADRQKAAFRKDPANQGRFISSGLWAWSRHPNYFGEITLWTGMAILAIPVLSGWQWVVLISPVFVYLLLTRISGTPMLERRADKKWGDDPDYQRYKESTPVLVPRPPSG